MTNILGCGKPDELKCVGMMGKEKGKEVDIFGNIALKYPDDKMGLITWSGLANSQEETKIIGTKGIITINSPAHAPDSLTVQKIKAY